MFGNIHWIKMSLTLSLFFSAFFKRWYDGSLSRFLFTLCWSFNRLKCDSQFFFFLVIAILALRVKVIPYRKVMRSLLIYIHNGGIWEATVQPRLKMRLIFLVTKVFQKGTMFKWLYDSLYVRQWSVMRLCDGPSVCSHPLPSEKMALWQPSQIRLSAILVIP